MLWRDVRPGDMLVTDGLIVHHRVVETMLVLEIKDAVPFNGRIRHPVRVMRKTNDEPLRFTEIYVEMNWSLEEAGWQTIFQKRR